MNKETITDAQYEAVFDATVAVEIEAIRHLQLWGEQNHDNGKWLEILIEELGEASQAGLQGDVAHQINELSHVAAVAVSWMQCLQRKADM